MSKVTENKVRTPQEHLEEIKSLFFDRMAETTLTPNLKAIEDIPQAFKLLTDEPLTETERQDLTYNLCSALSDATEGFLFEYLLQEGYYKSEDDICQDGETSGQIIQDHGETIVDMKIKSEFSIYVQMSARLFEDEDYLLTYCHDMIDQFETGRKGKVFLQFIHLREELKSDIEGLEIQWEQRESTDQLDDLSKERLDSQLYVLRNVHNKVKNILELYYNVSYQPIVTLDNSIVYSCKNGGDYTKSALIADIVSWMSHTPLFIELSGYVKEKTLEIVYSTLLGSLTWQCPATLLSEWDQDDVETVLKKLQEQGLWPENQNSNQSATVFFERHVTIDIEAGMDDAKIRQAAVDQFNTSDPEYRDMALKHIQVVEIL
jgi:hypothetical protein